MLKHFFKVIRKKSRTYSEKCLEYQKKLNIEEAKITINFKEKIQLIFKGAL